MTTLTRPNRQRCPQCQQMRYIGQFTAKVVLDKDPSRMHAVESEVCKTCQTRPKVRQE